jgi:putative intracellular protease/amidase
VGREDYDRSLSEFKVDKQVGKADPNSYDALMLPGGQMNPDHLRMDKTAVQFVQSFVRSGKPIAEEFTEGRHKARE